MSGRHRQVYHELSKGVCQLKIWCRGKTSVAYACPDTQNNPRGQRRVSKHERKAMLECFVNRYRKLNAGKFPTPSDAQKEVGGSYYFVRWTIQELQQKAINSPLDDTNEYTINGELRKESKPLCEVEEIKGSSLTDNEDMQNDSQTIVVKHVKIGDLNAKHLKGKTGAQTFACTEKALSKEFIKQTIGDNQSDFVAIQNQGKGQTEEVTDSSVEKPEHNATDKAASKVALSLDGPRHKGEQSQVPLKLSKYAGETSVKQTLDEAHPKISILWENLKSLADGIINMWRRH